jgi:hypothetical protein
VKSSTKDRVSAGAPAYPSSSCGNVKPAGNRRTTRGIGSNILGGAPLRDHRWRVFETRPCPDVSAKCPGHKQGEHQATRIKLRLGEIQLAPCDDGALIDLQSHGYDTMGQAYKQHACSAMGVEEMRSLRDALTRMLTIKFPKQGAA